MSVCSKVSMSVVLVSHEYRSHHHCCQHHRLLHTWPRPRKPAFTGSSLVDVQFAVIGLVARASFEADKFSFLNYSSHHWRVTVYLCTAPPFLNLDLHERHATVT